MGVLQFGTATRPVLSPVVSIDLFLRHFIDHGQQSVVRGVCIKPVGLGAPPPDRPIAIRVSDFLILPKGFFAFLLALKNGSAQIDLPVPAMRRAFRTAPDVSQRNGIDVPGFLCELDLVVGNLPGAVALRAQRPLQIIGNGDEFGFLAAIVSQGDFYFNFLWYHGENIPRGGLRRRGNGGTIRTKQQ